MEGRTTRTSCARCHRPVKRQTSCTIATIHQKLQTPAKPFYPSSRRAFRFPRAFGRDGVLEIANARGACGNPASGRNRVAVGRATGRVGSLAVQECGLAVEIERVKLWEVVIPVAEVVRSPGRVCALMVMTATSDDVSSDVSQDSATKPNTSPTNKVLFLNLSHYLQPQPTPGLQEGPRYALSSGQTSRTRHRYKHPKSTHPSRCRTNPQARCGSLPVCREERLA